MQKEFFSIFIKIIQLKTKVILLMQMRSQKGDFQGLSKLK